MCGFFIKVGGRELNKSQRKKISNLISLRGGDAQDWYIDDMRNVDAYHARLAIHDLSENAKQPMLDSRECVLLFNGEIYNFLSLKEKLIDEFPNLHFKSTSDTEVLLNLIFFYGFYNAIDLIEGMYSIVYYDSTNHKIYYAVDRFSQKPLYYYYSEKNGVMFSSIPFFNENNLINNNLIDSLFQFGAIPGHLSLVDGWEKILGGVGELNIKNTNFLTKLISNVDSKKSYKLSPYPEHINWGDIFRKVLSEYSSSDVPLAFLVSAGYDSCTLMSGLSLLPKDDRKNILCVSGVTGINDDEAFQAAKICRHLGLKHKIINLQEADIPSVFNNLVSSMPEPLLDPATLNLALLSKALKVEGITVGVTGDGGDELFGGYEQQFIFSKQKRIGATGLGHFLMSFIGKIPWLIKPLIFDRILSGRIPSHNDDYEHHIRSTCGSYRNCIFREKGTGHPKLVSFFSGNVVSDYKFRIPHRFCPKVDNSGMSCGVELRVPFLDERLINYIKHIGADGGRSFQKEFILKYIPGDLLPKEKKGFAISVRSLINNKLHSELKKYSNSNKKEIFNLVALSQTRFKTIVFLNRIFPIYTKDLWYALVLLKWADSRLSETE